MEKELTIVIPAKNEEDYIGRLLEELSLQRIGKTQIFLADAKSTDNTILEAKKTAYDLGLNLEIIAGGMPAVGRNRGAKRAKTPYVLFIDADVTFSDRFDLSNCLEKVKGFDLLTTTPKMRTAEDKIAVFLMWVNRITTQIISLKYPFAVGGFTLVNRDVFLSLGGYDEEVKHTEDWLFSKRVDPKRFVLTYGLITQDNRRFKKFGYYGMIKLMWKNWKNRNNRDYFLKDAGYW
jgi:glycosyltransferase involved in cell wall biosynthesis